LLQATLMVAYQGPLQNPPDDYLGYSICVTLCCCWLVGIFAIIRSSECRAAIAAGDRVTAEKKSREARSKARLALILGIAINVFAGIVVGISYGMMFAQISRWNGRSQGH
jgi:Interferon-induced transmembrane protein